MLKMPITLGKSSASLLGGKHVLTNGVASCPVGHQVMHSEGYVTIGGLTDCVREVGVNQKDWMLK